MSNKIQRSGFIEYFQYSNNQQSDGFRKRDSDGRWQKNDSPAVARNRAREKADRDRRRIEADRRRAVSERRAGGRHVAAIGNEVPGIFSSVLGVALALVFMVHLLGIIVNGSDVMNFFAGDSSDIVQTDGFYHIGAQVETVKLKSNTGTEITTDMMTGKYVSASETFDWVKKLAGDFKDYAKDPIAYSAQIFWNFMTDTFKGFATGETEDAEGNKVYNQWVHDAIKGLADWWNSIFATEEK